MKFSTGFDYIFSRIIANELLAGYIRKALFEKEEVNVKVRPLPWTASKEYLAYINQLESEDH